MAKINLQFHAVQDEIINIIKSSATKHDLFVVLIQLFPEFNCELISKESFGEKIENIKNYRFIFLYNYRPDVTIKDYNEFLCKNNNCLIFEIGEQDGDKLKESRVSTITDDIETLKIWKIIIKELKSSMLKGAWVINPMNGAKQFYKNHYYSYSAKKAFEDGIEIKAFAGWCLYILDEEYRDETEFN